MDKRIQDTLRIIELQDTKKLKKERKGKKTELVRIEVRKVTIEDDDKTFRISLTQEREYHPLKKLEITDLNSEVEVDLKLFLTSRQASIQSFGESDKEAEE